MSELLEERIEEERFSVDDDQAAEWCIRKIKEAEEQKAFWKAHYDAQYKRVCDSNDAIIETMTTYLRDYFERIPHKVTKTQESYQLPSAKLVMKRQEPEYERNDSEVIRWLHENNGEQYIKTKESLDWSGMKKSLMVMGETVADEYGQIIPCIKVKPREDIFKVE